MMFWGTLLVLVGSAFAVIQSVWIFIDTGRRRSRLRAGKARSDLRERRISQLASLLDGEPDDAALQAEYDRLRHERAAEDWVQTYASMERIPGRAMQDLQEAEEDWHRLWTHGALGLIGGVLALAGGVMIAYATV